MAASLAEKTADVKVKVEKTADVKVKVTMLDCSSEFA
jgi:hypothetical protein